MIQTNNSRKHLFTPLRYPGGKTSLFSFFDGIIQKNSWKDVTYIEPYAGGAGAALSLLFLEKVNRIVINDYDSAIYSFWLSVINQTNDFIKLIESTPLTVDEWDRQKHIYKIADLNDRLSLGFATFYLNRTNRSGILNGGPIGGRDQAGDWKIDARYNKQNLVKKIERIGESRDKITVLNIDGANVIKEYADDQHSFFYIDPPYFIKGANLYLNAFKLEDHRKLADVLNKYSNARWLLSYDNEAEILKLYPERRHEVFNLRYSAHHNTRLGSELMIFSDNIDLI